MRADVESASAEAPAAHTVRAPHDESLQLRYAGGPQTYGTHADFDVRSSEYSVFREQHYSWAEHGYGLMDRFYAGAGPLLDDEFRIVQEMSYHTYVCSHACIGPADGGGGGGGHAPRRRSRRARSRPSRVDSARSRMLTRRSFEVPSGTISNASRGFSTMTTTMPWSIGRWSAR